MEFMFLDVRYGFLLENVASQEPLSVSVAILHQFNILPEMYQVGYTKLFFRTGQARSSLCTFPTPHPLDCSILLILSFLFNNKK